MQTSITLSIDKVSFDTVSVDKLNSCNSTSSSHDIIYHRQMVNKVKVFVVR